MIDFVIRKKAINKRRNHSKIELSSFAFMSNSFT